MNQAGARILILLVIVGGYFGLRAMFSGAEPTKTVVQATEPTPWPVTTLAVEPTPEPTAPPSMFRVSLIIQNNANGGQWTVPCPDGCGSVGQAIHDEATGTWFTDVNGKFVWIKQGAGTILIQEQ